MFSDNSVRVQHQSSIPWGTGILGRLLRNELVQGVCDKKPIIKSGIKVRITYWRVGRNPIIKIGAKVQN